MYGYWRKPDVEPTVYGQALQQQELYDPTTSAVTRAYVGEAFRGVGTGYADIKAQESLTTEGNKLSEDDFKNTEFFKEGVQWYDGLTDKGAEVLRDFNIETRKRQQIIADSSTGQAALGFTIGFGAGIVEPKNLAIGVGTSLATGGLAEIGVLGNTMRRLYQAKKAASIGQKVAIGATEGVAAGVIAEPTNRYSAKTLQQDYTMADSLFNIATSTAFGAAVPAASSFIGAKIDKFRGRTMDVVTAEHDLATQQFVNSQRVDVSAVEAAEIGRLADKPIAQQARAAEAFVRFNESPEFKARFEGSKVVDEAGKPLMVYHGTSAAFDNFGAQTGKQGDAGSEAYFFTRDAREAAIYARESAHTPGDTTKGFQQGENIRPVYIDAKNPYYVKENGTVRVSEIRKAKSLGYDSVIDERGNIAVFSDKQIIPAFGEKSLPDIIAQAESQNATTIQKHSAATVDPRNDTLIDYDAIDAMEERRAITSVEGQAEAEAYLKEAEAEIQQMIDQDVLNEADLAEYQAAIEELNSSDTKDALNILYTCLTRG